ncbi:MAG: UDP-N-acetylmuramate--L-alanine ligase [Firmicutes bacterium]|nr:UDP-N-acetylmuramate--L-alanine ligase [Bacillota bacterium]
MSGIARVLLQAGYRVSGSDLASNDTTSKLAQLGATVYQGHTAAHISDGIDAVIVSSAVPSSNEEVLAARKKNIPIVHRGEMLASLMEARQGIAVAGAHGKTTTTAMVALALERNGLDPTIIVGGDLNELQGNAKLGQGEYLVAEADESDGSFLLLRPKIAVVTNIENDHLDHYRTVENIVQAFREFVGHVPADGLALLCADDPRVREIADNCPKHCLTYGVTSAADFIARDIVTQSLSTQAQIYYRGRRLGKLSLSIPGVHNVLNSLAAIAVGLELGLDFQNVADALHTFRGVHRRFEILGEVRGITVVDDYAHHPTEIKATLKAARQTEAKRVIVVFQPHRYTRTYYLQDEFGTAFSDAHVIIINEIYSAGEAPIAGVTAELLVRSIEKFEQRPVIYLPEKEMIIDYLEKNATAGDLILTMGAGNIWQVGVELVKRLRGDSPLS